MACRLVTASIITAARLRQRAGDIRPDRGGIMRVKTFVLCSTSAIGFALAATPALAQDTPPPPPDTTTTQGEPAPAASGTDTGDNGEAIVVTGLRRSLQSAQNIKRNAPQQIDAIVANDIGK